MIRHKSGVLFHSNCTNLQGAGAAALMKAILMFQKNVIPPQAGMPTRLNPAFPNLSGLNIEIPDHEMPFKPIADSGRTVLVNSFDASVSNLLP